MELTLHRIHSFLIDFSLTGILLLPAARTTLLLLRRPSLPLQRLAQLKPIITIIISRPPTLPLAFTLFLLLGSRILPVSPLALMSANELEIFLVSGDGRTIFNGNIGRVKILELGFVDFGEDGLVVGEVVDVVSWGGIDDGVLVVFFWGW